MKNIYKYVVLLLAACVIAGCGGRRNAFSVEGLHEVYAPQYADGFTVYEAGENSTIISIDNPWQGAQSVSMNLFLSRNGEQPSEGFDGVVVEAPLKNVICMSSTYIAYLDMIGETDAVSGVSGIRYISNPDIQSRYERGLVRDVGYDAYMNYELVATLAPDLVMIYGVSGENTQLTGKLDELGIKYIYIGDYVEQSPLGKSEWMVAMAEMFDKREHAESIFTGIRDRYNETRALVEQYMEFSQQASSGGRVAKPVVMLNAPYRDTWYLPGDRSYMVRLLTDAGAGYAGAGHDNDQSRPVSGESAYVLASKSDVWLNPGSVLTMKELVASNPKFSDIPPVRTGMVFNCNARMTPDGGSDFWESGAVRPDVVLSDLVKIFYPRLLPDHQLYYFRQIR